MSGAPSPGSSILANYSWSLLNLVLSKGLRFAAILIVIRQVGIDSWGQVVSAMVAVTFLGFVVDQGLSGLPQAWKVQDRDADLPLVRTITRYRLAMALAVFSALYLVRLASGSPSLLILCYSLVLFPRALSIDWIFHRRERYHLTLLFSTARMAAFFVLVAIFVRKGTSPYFVIALEMCAETAAVAFSYALLGRLGLSREAGAATLPIKGLLLFSFPVLINGLMDTALGSADILILKHLKGYAETGQYDIGGKIGMSYFFLGAALVQIILPKLARLHATGDPERMKAILGSAGKILIVLGTALMIPSFYFSEELVPLFVKHDYPLTVFVFRWLPIWVYITPLSMLNIILLLSMGRRKDYLWGSVGAAAVNVASNWALVLQLGGRGAVFARIAGEIFILAYSMVRMPGEFQGPQLRTLGIYAVNLAIQLCLYGAYCAFGQRWIFFPLSLAALAALALSQRTFGRTTWRVVIGN